ncbi:hypothetical protein Asch02_00783 [Acinetobacter schindleri]
MVIQQSLVKSSLIKWAFFVEYIFNIMLSIVNKNIIFTIENNNLI